MRAFERCLVRLATMISSEIIWETSFMPPSPPHTPSPQWMAFGWNPSQCQVNFRINSATWDISTFQRTDSSRLVSAVHIQTECGKAAWLRRSHERRHKLYDLALANLNDLRGAESQHIRPVLKAGFDKFLTSAGSQRQAMAYASPRLVYCVTRAMVTSDVMRS